VIKTHFEKKQNIGKQKLIYLDREKNS